VIRVSAQITKYFAYIAFRLLQEHGADSALPILGPVRPEALRSAQTRGDEGSPPSAYELSSLRRYLITGPVQAYLIAFLLFVVAWDARLRAPRVTSFMQAEMSRLAVAIIELLHNERDKRPAGEARDLLHEVVQRELDHLYWLYARRAEEVDPQHAPGPFSELLVEELVPLAHRSDAMRKKYGGKRAEKVLEQRLSLLAQSFGFYVVGTRTGRSTVDLICLSPSPQDPYTFLLEAKSSKGSYAFPKADQRALRDYIADVMGSLTTLPPLRFALVAGPTPTSTVAGKVRALEARVSLPVRYTEVAHLVALREELPGPPPPRDLLNELLQADPVLPPTFGTDIGERYRRAQQAHVDLVEAMLSLGIEPDSR
jgi:hypothetical protein